METKLGRRQLGKGLAALTLGCTAKHESFAYADAPDAGAFGRISLNSYSFNQALNDKIKGRDPSSCIADLRDVLDFCAKYNVDAIDPTGYFFPNFPNRPPPDFLAEFKAKATALGITISGTGVRNDFAQPDPAARAADVAVVKTWCDVAAELGAPVLRVFAGVVPLGYEQRWEEVATWMADELRRCAEYGKQRGVKIGIQNHGDMLRSAEQIIRVLELVDSEWLGVINDTGYYSTPDPYVDIEQIMPYTISIQVKESVRPVKRHSPFKTDLPRLLRIIHDSGYRGFLPIETLPTVDQKSGQDDGDYNPSKIVPNFLTELRAAIQQTTGQAVPETPPPAPCPPAL